MSKKGRDGEPRGGEWVYDQQRAEAEIMMMRLQESVQKVECIPAQRPIYSLYFFYS